MLETSASVRLSSFLNPLPRHHIPVSMLRTGAKRDPAALTRRNTALLRADEVLRTFNTWSFKREQPSDVGLLIQSIGHAIATNASVPFVLYWGKGPRNHIAPPDLACLDYLLSLSTRIRAVYERGAVFRLILTDTHALLNGHSPDNIVRYYLEIENAASQYGFEICWLSSLVDFANIEQKEVDSTIEPDVLKALSISASHWYQGPKTYVEAAKDYYRINMIEKRAVEMMFPRAIFVTFNGSKVRCLFPENMPIFYMYSLRKGFSSKPWFLGHSAAARTDGEGV